MNPSKGLSLTHLRLFYQETPRKFCRDFGFLLAAVLVVLGLWKPGVGFFLQPSLLVGALVSMTLSFLQPEILKPLAGLWRGLAVVLHTVMSPVTLFLLYFLILTPVGLVLRLFAWDPLRIQVKKDVESHWLQRSPPGPAPESYRQQF